MTPKAFPVRGCTGFHYKVVVGLRDIKIRIVHDRQTPLVGVILYPVKAIESRHPVKSLQREGPALGDGAAVRLSFINARRNHFAKRTLKVVERNESQPRQEVSPIGRRAQGKI